MRAESRVWDLVQALLVLLLVGIAAILPPIENQQIVGIVEHLREPLVAVIVAGVVLVVAKLFNAVITATLIAVFVFASLQVGLYVYSTHDGTEARATAASWSEVQLTSTDEGETQNEPNEIGQASLSWSGNDFTLALTSNVGTSQQGPYWDGGDPDGSFYFSARTDTESTTPYTGCPLMFGVTDTRNYYMFYIDEEEANSFRAHIVQRVQAGPNLNDGFTGRDFKITDPQPSVGYWNILDRWQDSQVELAIRAVGRDYSFFVNDRLIFQDTFDEGVSRTVTIGDVAVTNDAATQLSCNFYDVGLRVDG